MDSARLWNDELALPYSLSERLSYRCRSKRHGAHKHEWDQLDTALDGHNNVAERRSFYSGRLLPHRQLWNGIDKHKSNHMDRPGNHHEKMAIRRCDRFRATRYRGCGRSHPPQSSRARINADHHSGLCAHQYAEPG